MKYAGLNLPRDSAFGYVEYGFDSTTGTLPAGGNSGGIQSRLANANWSYFQQANDYSYANNSAYTPNSRITLYRNGQLVWGVEPVAVTPVVSVKAYSLSNNAGLNTISNYLKINNEGNMPVSYGDISARYWFTADGTSPLNAWIDYAWLGSTNITAGFTSLSPVRDSAGNYLEFTINPGEGALYPSSTTGNIQYRIAKSDWSNFIQGNDYSYNPSSSFTANSHITLYYKGQLIWGTEPSQAVGAAASRWSSGQGVLMDADGAKLAIYPNPVTDLLNIVVGKVEPGAMISVYNVKGRLIYAERLTNLTQSISFADVAAGVYMVQVRNGSSWTVKKIIKK
jgi:hypothetical protein